MEAADDSAVSPWEFTPWGYAASWLRGWLAGSESGLPDYCARSRLIASDEPGNRVLFRFEELGWQPILLPGHLERLVRGAVMYESWRGKGAADYLSDALRYLRRDFDALLSEGRMDAWTPAQLSHYARVVRLAQTGLSEHPGTGGMGASERVEGWHGLAAVAYAIATTAAVRSGRSPRLVPSVPATCSGYDELSAYFHVLDEAAVCGGSVEGSAAQPHSAPTEPVPLLGVGSKPQAAAAPTSIGKPRRGHLSREKREEQLLGYFTGGANPPDHRRRLTASYRVIAEETGIPLRTVQRIMEDPKAPALKRLIAQRLDLAKEM